MSLKKKQGQVEVTPGLKKKNPFVKDLTTNYNLYLMILPAVLITFLFSYMAMYGIQIAFKKYSLFAGVEGSPWVGLYQFKRFFSDPYFFRLLKNTLVLGTTNWIFNFFPPIILAILMTELRSMKLKKAVQTITYLPHFIPTVVIVGIIVTLMSPTGIVNKILVENLGVTDEAVLFFNEPSMFRPIYIISDIWAKMGWGSIVFMAAISGVDQQLFEAAYLDGANRFQRIWHITIPSILPTITIMIVLGCTNIINVAQEKALLLQNPAIYETADVINTYVYRYGFSGVGGSNFSYTTAIGLFNSVISCILVLTTNKIVKVLNGAGLW